MLILIKNQDIDTFYGENEYIYVYIVYVFKYIYTERQEKVLEENKVLNKKPIT